MTNTSLLCQSINDTKMFVNCYLHDGRGSSLSNEGTQLFLEWKLDDVPIQEKPRQEVLDLLSMS